MKNKIIITLISLWLYLDKKRKRQFYILMALTLVTSVMEVLSIGAVLPFIAALVSPEKLLSISYVSTLWNLFGIKNSEHIREIITIIFCIASIATGVSRLMLMWWQTTLGNNIGADISHKIYSTCLYRPYSYHLEKNSSEIIAAATNKANMAVYESILPALTIITSAIIFTIIFVALIAIEPLIMFFAFLLFGAVYALAIILTRKKLIIDGIVESTNQSKLIKVLQEGLGGIRDVILDGSQQKYIESYKEIDKPLRKARANIQILANSPRFIVESICMVVIAAIGFSVTKNNGAEIMVLPLMGTIVLGAQRLLPLIQQGFYSLTKIRGGYQSLLDVLDLMNDNEIIYENFKNGSCLYFNKSIKLNRVAFAHKGNDREVLRNISFEILKGDKIGIIGTSGCGKSTLLDLLMGLLQPAMGEILIDEILLHPGNCKSWQKNIAHVPQNIFLTDGTVAENICMSSNLTKAQRSRMLRISEIAGVHSFVKKMPLEYESVVGERGVRLSGGQRQRIGIARALYKGAHLMIMDEATSALDVRTEAKIVNLIESEFPNITIIQVAHRMASLRNCDRIIHIFEGGILKIGRYEDFFN